MTYNQMAANAYTQEIDDLDADIKRREAELKLLKGIRKDRVRNGEKTKAMLKAAQRKKTAPKQQAKPTPKPTGSGSNYTMSTNKA